MWRIEGPYIVYEDGTRLRAISGAQDVTTVPAEFVNIYNGEPLQVDAILNVGATEASSVPSSDLPGSIEAGVPFGDPLSPGNQSLADIIRSGGSVPTAESINAGSLSDILRSGGTSGTFDYGSYNPNVPTDSQAGSFSVMDVVDGITKIGSLAVGAIATLTGKGSSASANPAQKNTTTAPSLAQTLFGTAPGKVGNVPSSWFLGAIVFVFAILGFMVLSKKGAAA